MANYGTDRGLADLEKIKKISDGQLQLLTGTLNNIKKINIKSSSNDFINILETAIAEVEGIPDIRIIREYSPTAVYCFLDCYHLTQLFANILHNAVEAIQKQGEKDGVITIRVITSSEWLFCSITDNGCGMNKKMIKKRINFTQQQPTRPNHFGLGLPYIFQIIHAHGGHLKFKSKQGVFTTVEILLPQAGRFMRKE